MRASVSGSPSSRGAQLIELRQIVEQRPPLSAVDARRIVEVQHRVGARPQADALMRRRQEAAAPQPREDRLPRVLARALRDHRDERRQVLVLAPQAVADPRPHAGVAGLLVAGVHEGDRRVVVDRLGVHRLDDADLVGDRLHVRQQVADPRAAARRSSRPATSGATTGYCAWPEVMPVSRWLPFTDGGISWP